MTDELKQTLFNYLMGDLKNTSPDNSETFDFMKDIDRNSWNGFMPKGWDNFNIEDIIQFPENVSDKFVAYGGYIDTNNQVVGYICLLDSKFMPVKMFTEFNNGTRLRYIQCMYIDEDGTVVAIDDTAFTSTQTTNSYSSQKRFIMLNNFSIISTTQNDYILSLNKSYNLPSDYQNFYCHNIGKDPSSSTYCLVGDYLKNSFIINATRAIQLKINVGSSNEWNKWDYGSSGNSNETQVYGASQIFYNEGKLQCKILATNTPNYNTTIVKLNTINDTTSNTQNIYTLQGYAYMQLTGKKQAVFCGNDIWFVLDNQTTPIEVGTTKNIRIELFKYSNGSVRSIYHNDLGSVITNTAIYKEKILLTSIQNKVYILHCTDENEDNIGNYYLFRYENEWSPILIKENAKFYFNFINFISTFKYNLLSFYIFNSNINQTYWLAILIKEIYNPNYYSGSKYKDENSMIAQSSIIYDEEEPVFARNLYNKTINGNTTTSIVEILNTYLNGIDLTSKNLLSETNLTMIADTNVTQKNIYETMFLNFINVLQVANRNNATQVLNQEASTYLNSAINTDDSYDNAKLYNKVIINYQDGSSKESSYSLENTTETSTVIAFGLYIDKLINNAEIVSSDKTITYQTIDLSSLELNKSYSIKQKLEVV